MTFNGPPAAIPDGREAGGFLNPKPAACCIIVESTVPFAKPEMTLAFCRVGGIYGEDVPGTIGGN